ncbi:unnamed protein product, partial [Staurois parvus]
GRIVPHHWYQWGGGIVSHHWYQWGEEYCPIIGVSGGRNSAPLLVSMGGGIVPHRWCHWGRNSAPSDTNDGALFLPLTPMMGHYSSH